MPGQKLFSELYKFKLHHILLWIMLYCLLAFLYRGDPSLKLTAPLIYLIFIAIAAYIILYRLVPVFLYKKRIALFIVSFVTTIALNSVLLLSGLKLLYYYFLKEELSDFKIYHLFYDTFLAIAFYVSIALVIKFITVRFRERNYLEKLEKDRMTMEINFLKAQMNPHFLLNSLNTIYYKIDKQNFEARDTLMKFSDMLKYQLYDCNANEIIIEKELEYLKNYVNLQKLRLNENYNVSFIYEEEITNFMIVPHLLIPFVENAFKHISHYDEKPNEIMIKLSKQNSELILNVLNTTEQKEKTNEQNGIGLINVKKRLLLLYPDNHELKISDRENSFEVELKLKII